jgi:hypothetical protein
MRFDLEDYAGTYRNTRYAFRANRFFQSKQIYLQAIGSTSEEIDGSPEGFHLRWDFVGDLRGKHLPKGDKSAKRFEYNRPDDYVRIYRTPYITKFPSTINLSKDKPKTVNAQERFWVFICEETKVAVYFHFLNATIYDAILISPLTNPKEFIEAYGAHPIHVEVKDELFFGVNLLIDTNTEEPLIKIETISVQNSEEKTAKYITCRHQFDTEGIDGASLLEEGNPYVTASYLMNEYGETTQEDEFGILLENSVRRGNLLKNPSFSFGNVGFESEYTCISNEQNMGPDCYAVVESAYKLNRSWKGLPKKGREFLAVDGSSTAGKILWRQRDIQITANTAYMFEMFLTNLYSYQRAILKVKITGNQTNESVEQTFTNNSTIQGKWESFKMNWNSASNTRVTIEISDVYLGAGGNDFGIDELYFGIPKEDEVFQKAEVRAENMTEIRLQVEGGFLQEIQVETYKHYHNEVEARLGWTLVATNALSTNYSEVENRLKIDRTESPSPIRNWKKFDGEALINQNNYMLRWYDAENPDEGIRKGVDDYLTLSTVETNRNQLGKILATDDSGDKGDFNVNLIDMINLVATDYHVARMLGLGHIDRPLSDVDTPYVYVMEYITESQLSGMDREQGAVHLYMTLPITKKENKPCHPVNLIHNPIYGIFKDDDSHTLSELTDENGYTPTGKSRFVNVMYNPVPDLEPVKPFTGQAFFNPSTLFCSNEYTSPILVGMKYKKQGDDWNIPELLHNQDGWLDTIGNAEVAPTPFEANVQKPIFMHMETHEGIHHYGAYGINWFSRPSQLGTTAQTDNTHFPLLNTLLAPSNFHAQLIQHEDLEQLIFTSAQEQAMLQALKDDTSKTDKTLVRLTFNYHQMHDLAYQRYTVDGQTVLRNFGDQVEFKFRTEAPAIITGAVKQIDYSAAKTTVIRTRSYTQYSQDKATGNVINPNDFSVSLSNFIGGTLVVDGDQYFILNAEQGATGEGPKFTVSKNKTVDGKEVTNTDGMNVIQTTESWKGPLENYPNLSSFTAGNDQIIMALENIGTENSWSTGYTLTKKVTLGGTDDWEENGHLESYTNSQGEARVERYRGFTDTVKITEFTEATQPGVYEIIFDNLELANHPQFESDQVNWFNGNLRVEVPTSNGNGQDCLKYILRVIKTENIGVTGQKLKLYAIDSTPKLTDIDPNHPEIGQHIATNNHHIKLDANGGVHVNFYPGYKIYVHAEGTLFNQNVIARNFVNAEKRTFISARTLDLQNNYTSNYCTPATLLAIEVKEPGIPATPTGGTYATFPDFYGKSTYTFKMKFPNGEPYAAVFYRANETSILDALFNPATVTQIELDLKNAKEQVGGDPFFVDRWKNLIEFDYTAENGTFKKFGNSEPGNVPYGFPNPNKTGLFSGAAMTGEVRALVKAAVYEAFLPLTEQPILYQYINRTSPVNKKQNLRKLTGEYLDPSDATFDMAPMVIKTSGNQSELQFTDYTLDGAANNVYFYCGREIGNLMKLGEYGPIVGPIFLVNASPAEEPKIMKTLVQLQDVIQEIPSAVKFQLANYDEVQQIEKIRIYRANKQVDAMSVRTMEMVKEVTLTEEDFAADNLQIVDDFTGELVPYGDSLFYRIVALRGITYDKNGVVTKEYAPSKPSKLVLTGVVDVVNPIAPDFTIAYTGTINENTSEITNVKLTWQAITYNATYYVYKMNSSGNWVKIHEFKSNDLNIEVKLSETSLASDTLAKKDEEDNTIYHRFKVDVLNSSGLLNLEENTQVI